MGVEILDGTAQEAHDRWDDVHRASRSHVVRAQQQEPGEDDAHHRDRRKVVHAGESPLPHVAPPTTPPIWATSAITSTPRITRSAAGTMMRATTSCTLGAARAA